MRSIVGIAQQIGVLRLVDIYWKSITRKSRLISRIYCVQVSIDSRADTPSLHYNDVMMSAIASRITSLTIVYSTVCSRRRSKKTSKIRVTGLCEGIHRWPVNSPHKGTVTRKMFPFEDVIVKRLTGQVSTSTVICPRWAPCWPHEPCYQGWAFEVRRWVNNCIQSLFRNVITCSCPNRHAGCLANQLLVIWAPGFLFLWPSGVIWRHRPRSTLALVIGVRLDPIRYLNRYVD